MESDPEGARLRDVQDVDDREHGEIVELIEPLRRYVAARVPQQADRDDVVQEALVRIMELGPEAAPTSSLGYAIVVARHLIADRYRESSQLREHAHRLIDLRSPRGPEQVLVDHEEQQALRSALAGVPGPQRELLMQHVLDQRPVAELVAGQDRSDGSRAAQLARTRARLRLDYVLALRAITLPTARCRPILLALSARDTRRQVALRAGQHLLTCATCAEVAPALLQRRRALAAVLPWLGLGPLLGLLRRRLSQAPIQTAAAMTAVVVTAAGTGGVVWVTSAAHPASPGRAVSAPEVTSSAPRSAPATSAGAARLVQVDSRETVTAQAGELRSLAGRKVSAVAMPVLAVPANEGFWIGDATSGRVWVQLRTHGAESQVTVKPGDLVTFTATVEVNARGFTRQVGVDAAEGAAQLDREGAHLSVTTTALHVRTRKHS